MEINCPQMQTTVYRHTAHWYDWKQCGKSYVLNLVHALSQNCYYPTHTLHAPWHSTKSVMYHIESPASISPSSMVASLLPVRTGQHNQAMYGCRRKNILMGSLGWKSTAVTVPLWPGSCDDIHEYHSPRENGNETHLIQDITALHVPDTHHSVSSSDGCTTSIVILTPSSTQ